MQTQRVLREHKLINDHTENISVAGQKRYRQAPYTYTADISRTGINANATDLLQAGYRAILSNSFTHEIC